MQDNIREIMALAPARRNAELRQAANDQRKRAIRLSPPDTAPLTPQNRKALREAAAGRALADNLLAKARAAMLKEERVKARGFRRDALQQLVAVRYLEALVANDRQARADAAWRARTLTETIQLERARGEQVEVSDGKPSAPGRPARPRGQARISTRDGLETLRALAIDPAKGYAPITARQYAAGMRYRTLYEAADPERALGSQLGKLQATTITPSRDPGGAETRQLNAARALAALDRHIRDEGGADGKEWLNAVRAVAGEARSLHSRYGGGRKGRAARVALELGLDVIADLMGM